MPLMINNPGSMLMEQPNAPLADIADASQVEQAAQQEYDELRRKVTDLQGYWKSASEQAAYRRRLRHIDVNQAVLREKGEIAKDEIYIQVHVVDDNINKEISKDYAYITTSKNAALFKRKKGNALDTEPLENFYTSISRYPGWEFPHYKTIDGSKLHGWDCSEIVADRSKDGKFAIEHVGHENLWFSEDCEDIQKAPVVVRNINVTEEDLMKFDDVNKIETAKLFEKQHNLTNTRESTIELQKVYWRKEYIGSEEQPPIPSQQLQDPITGMVTVTPEQPQPPKTVNYGKVVMVGWMVVDKGVNTWIRPPKPLYFGRRKPLQDELSGEIVGDPKYWPISYEILYPFKQLFYQITENDKLIEAKGRAFLDEPTQEAASSMESSIVTGTHRAAQMYASPANPLSGGQLEQLDVALVGGRIYSQPLAFAHTEYPPASSMGMLNGILNINKGETVNLNVAAMNREDSRKTAEELKTAKSEASMQTGIKLTLLSFYMRSCHISCWSIAQSYFQQQYQIWKNAGSVGECPIGDLDPRYLFEEYEIYSAGDTEVLKREETLNNLKSVLPVFMGGNPMFMPVALVILKDILKLSFPSGGDKYIAALDQAASSAGNTQQLADMLARVTSILEAIVTQHADIIPDNQEQQIGTLVGMAKSCAAQAMAQGQGMMQQGNMPNAKPPMPMTKPQLDGNQGMMKV